MPNESMERPKEKRDAPEASRDLTPLSPNEIVSDERLLYGSKWRQGAKLVGQIRRRVEKSKRESAPEDYAVASSVCQLLETTFADDRIAHFHQEFDEILEQSEKEKWGAESLNHHLLNLKMAYLMGDEEFAQEMTRRRLTQFHSAIIPRARFRFEKKDEARVELYKFSSVCFSFKDQTVSLKMEPVYDGKVESVAYPVKALKFTVSESKPIDMKVTFRFRKPHDIHQELPNHPELRLFVRNELVRVINMYRENREELVHKRGFDGNEDDPFQLKRPFFEFLENDYLKGRLDGHQYKSFKRALTYVDSGNIIAVVGLRAMAEQIIDEQSFLRNDWFAKNYPQELQMVIETAGNALKELGCQIEEGQIANFFEIVNRAAQDSRFAKRLNKIWGSIFKGGDKIAMGMMRDDVKRLASIYRWNLEMAVFQKALEMARGVVIIDGTFFSRDKDQSQPKRLNK